eukprot:6487793-Amphidinium_carterae.2
MRMMIFALCEEMGLSHFNDIMKGQVLSVAIFGARETSTTRHAYVGLAIAMEPTSLALLTQLHHRLL